MGTTITTDVNVKPSGAGTDGKGSGDSGGPFNPGSGDPNNWPPGFTRDDAIEPDKYRIGMWVGLASILMLFVALTSAYILRQTRGLSEVNDWVPLEMPVVLWFNTALILISSLSIELARRALKRNDYARFRVWIALTTLLGIAFLAGQIIAWRQLAGQGIYVDTHPHSSFFYLLTSLHALHLLGGIIALAYVTIAGMRLRISLRRRTVVGVTALYWHFMDGLWIYLFLLLFFWR
ncbi:MAG TPA: cytochrome c oxidase subunit 3 [Blastocatellia bacterium]|nr:cytochrome c oxidase subunit 3 [Blastocatellia bacterium]